MRQVALLLLIACAFACGKKHGGLAELTRADGPVEKQVGNGGTWSGANIGTKFELGDAARTADGGAQITLLGTQVLEMQPHTVLRFGANNLKVELGAIDVINTAQSGLEIGNVKIAPGGKVRITSNNVELVMGTAQLINGTALEIGKPVGLEISGIVVVDAGVPADAAAAPPIDAGVSAGDITFEITGKGAELQGPNDRTWAPVEGKGSIPIGAKLRLKKAGAKAVLVSGSITFELSGASSQITVQPDLLLGLDLGTGIATVPAATSAKVGVPGGRVEISGGKDQPAEARIDVNARGEAKVAMVHGGGKLVGANGSSALELSGGESATMLKAGTINPGVVIPRYFDFQIKVGEAPKAFVVHDPKGSTAIQFDFNGKCPTGGTVEIDHDGRFRTPRVSEGKDTANMLVPGGSWAWRLRCGSNSAAGGQVSVIADSGRRPLPPKPAKNAIDADGRAYTVAYQSLLPNIEFHYKGTGGAFRLHLATGGVDETYDAVKPVIEVPGKKLKEGTYTFWFDKDGVKQDKVTTLKIEFDQTAAQVYIESPADGAAFANEVLVSGAALPGWTASIMGIEIPVDQGTRRFRATVQPPSGGAQALAIRLSHPQRGIHYYLRRGSAPK